MLERNLNDYIRVCFTETGFELLATEYNASAEVLKLPLKTVEDFKKETDKEGFYPMQFHQFMRTFGRLPSISLPKYFSMKMRVY
mgnify:FL=1